MAKRIIECTVNDEYVMGSGVPIGAAGSHDDVILRLTFNDTWIGLNKYATFRNSTGEEPTIVLLLPTMLVDGTDMTYDVMIPGAAKTYSGRAMLTLTGYSIIDGTEEDVATNSATAFFRVLESDFAFADDGSVDATIAQQLQSSMEEHQQITGELIQAINSQVQEYEREIVKIAETQQTIIQMSEDLTAKVEKAVTLNDNGSVATHDSSQAIGDYSFAGGLNNIAYSRDVFVGGFGNIAGGKGFKIIGQGAGETEGEGYYDLTSVDGIEVGQNYIVRLSSVSANISGKIVNVANNRVYVNGYEPKLLIEGESGNNPETRRDISRAASDTNYLCIVGHPELGDVSVGFNAVVFGEGNIATDRSSASFGRQNKSLGQYSFTEGRLNTANYGSHAEGFENSAIGITSHAEGRKNTVYGDMGHGEGVSNTVTGYAAHGEGQETKALGPHTHTEGYGTIAIGDNQHVQGRYNIEDAKYAHIIGNGSSNSNRSNAHTVDWEGNAWYKGKVKVGGTSYDDAYEVATQDFVIAKINEVLASFINVSEEGA